MQVKEDKEEDVLFCTDLSIFFPVWQHPDLTNIHQRYQKDIRTGWISPAAPTQIPTHSCVKIASEKGTGESKRKDLWQFFFGHGHLMMQAV